MRVFTNDNVVKVRKGGRERERGWEGRKGGREGRRGEGRNGGRAWNLSEKHAYRAVSPKKNLELASSLQPVHSTLEEKT